MSKLWIFYVCENEADWNMLFDFFDTVVPNVFVPFDQRSGTIARFVKPACAVTKTLGTYIHKLYFLSNFRVACKS